MNLRHHLSPAMLALALLCGPTLAQQNPPPWWRVNDDVTVSLFYDFSGPLPPQPAFAVTPSWYQQTVTGWTLPPNVVILPTLTTHTNVLAMVGNGAPQTASLSLKVDNDPHLDWIKIFWFQYDEFKGVSGNVASNIAKDLTKYGRATVTEEKRDPIGGGWEQVTISAKLIPQPDDEKLDWSFFESAFGTVAIDNLAISSKCVKPGDDEKGEALGKDEGLALDLFGATGIQDCRGAAVTEGPGPAFARTYWVSSRATVLGSFHQVFQLNQAGTVIGTTPLPDSVASAPAGGSDLAVATGPLPGQQLVYVLVDRRPANPVVLRAINTAGSLAPAFDVVLPVFPPPQLPLNQSFGLAFDPTGNLGVGGSFWVSDPNGNTYEFGRQTGALLETRTIAVGVPGAGFSGLGYDEKFGKFYGFSPTPRPSPFGPLQVNGFEWSGHTFQATGSEFLGNLNTGGATPRGGIATGLEVYRRGGTGDFRMVCVARDPGTSHAFLYELKGPFPFGWSQFGTCGMQGGPPFEGGGTFAVTLRGVPNSVAAFLYAGLSNNSFSGTPLPIPMALLGTGFDESHLSISLDVNIGSFAPTTPGRFVAPVLLPPAGGLSYVPLYFQWIVLDTSVPGQLAMSQAGKTIAY